MIKKSIIYILIIGGLLFIAGLMIERNKQNKKLKLYMDSISLKNDSIAQLEQLITSLSISLNEPQIKQSRIRYRTIIKKLTNKKNEEFAFITELPFDRRDSLFSQYIRHRTTYYDSLASSK